LIYQSNEYTSGESRLKANILTYHSQNVFGNGPARNDHHALSADLEALHEAGHRFVPLSFLMKYLAGAPEKDEEGPLVCLTFDDGCDFDVRKLEFPPHGMQQSFLAIMETFVKRHGKQAQPQLHATQFVIANARARQTIDQHSLFGRHQISDDWWKDSTAHPLLDLGNHSWDHNHPDLDGGAYPRGDFTGVDTLERCQQQITEAGRLIARLGGYWPQFFAYPFGESSDYLRQEFFPHHHAEHHCQAALGTTAGSVTENSNRWDLPRFVCGRDWSDPDELLAMIGP